MLGHSSPTTGPNAGGPSCGASWTPADVHARHDERSSSEDDAEPQDVGAGKDVPPYTRVGLMLRSAPMTWDAIMVRKLEAHDKGTDLYL